jgi:hypothetical protein
MPNPKTNSKVAGISRWRKKNVQEFAIGAERRQRIRVLCERHGFSMSEVVRRLVDDHLEEVYLKMISERNRDFEKVGEL